jgi:transposase-like protein
MSKLKRRKWTAQQKLRVVVETLQSAEKLAARLVDPACRVVP